jgi:FixJ family two-component response regulator
MVSQRKIVLVDDDDSLRRALARRLRLAGYDVQAFRSAEETIAARPCWSSACLVLDVDLPGMDGIAYRHALNVAGLDPPTVFITALDRGDVKQRMREPAVVLHKPFHNDELLVAIDRVWHA